MLQLWRDVRYAARGLTRSPGFTAVALLVLAVGIGANTAVFSVVYNVLLKPLNYREPERLVVALGANANPVSPADYLDYKAQTTDFAQMEAAQGGGGTLEIGSESEIVEGLSVTAGLLTMLGVPPEKGRLLRPGEDQPGAARVVVISHKLWQTRFGADPSIVGRPVRIAGDSFSIVGVMPPTFQFAPFWITQAEMWMPFDMSSRIQDRMGRSVRVFARLRPGVSAEQAQAQLGTVAKRLEQRYPESNTGVSVQVTPLQEMVTGAIRPTLLLLLATVAFVLMIACANIANLLLTRAVGRRREIAVRIAIGAGRWQLIRQLATESVMVSVAGGLAGILLAAWSLRLFEYILPEASLPRQGEIAMEPAVLAFAIAASLVTGLVAGLFPAMESSGIDVNENLKQGSRGSAGASRKARGFLVAAEVSLALVLLVCAGLMIRTLLNLNSVDPGFDPHRLLTMTAIPPSTDLTAAQRTARLQRINDAIARTPGVERVSAINHLPIGGDVWSFDYVIPGRPAPPVGQRPSAVYRVIRPAYFATMRTPLLRGREFTSGDNAYSDPVIIVNQALANRQWPGRNPVGETIEIAHVPQSPVLITDEPLSRFRIVGVSRNVRQSDWTSEPSEEFYLPFPQHTEAWDAGHESFVIRTAGDPEAITSAVEKAVQSAGPHIAMSRITAMDQIIGDKLWRSRLSALLLGAFAAIALVLAAVGIYGVISYSVQQRTQEIGIRIALGASRGDVVILSLRESIGPVLAGIATGAALSIGAAHWLSALLYGVQATDAMTFALVIAGMLAVAVAATIVPTARTLRTDVLASLRND